MSKQQKIKTFDPNGVGLENGHFIGLPFEEEEAEIVLLSIPWDVTVSYNDGTANGPTNILKASTQLDLFDEDVPDAWKRGLFMRPPSEEWLQRNTALRIKALSYINWLEEGSLTGQKEAMDQIREEVNRACEELKEAVKQNVSVLLGKGKLVGLIGGDHSCPLGYLEALAERHEAFGVLQIDAHMDLRKAYEGFTYSHASVFYNALELPQITRLLQVGVRDFCEEEYALANADDRIKVFYEKDIRTHLYQGGTFASLCAKMIESLPQKVYVSFDIDGLDPKLCPNTGTPVPGGFELQEAFFLFRQIVASGRQIIGFDLCEVAGAGEWDGNVGARVAYKLSNLLELK
ncbi:MAG: agmatinase family protein [Saprospiraceae bacterium]